MITALKDRKLLQRVVIVLIGIIVLIYSFEGIWGTRTVKPYTYLAPIGLLLMIMGICYGHLFRYHDTCLIALFLAFSWISTIFGLGLSGDFFTSRFFGAWMIFLGLYFAIQIVPDPIKAFTYFSIIYTFCMSLLCLYVLAHACKFLLSENPWVDLAKGCIKNGRLCGLSNANCMALACASLIIVAIFGFLNSGKNTKWLFILGALLGWFCLGLTGCRGGAIGIAFTAGLFTYIRLYKKTDLFRISNGFLRIVAVVILSIAAFVAVLKSFLLPIYIYKILMTGIAIVSGRSWAIPAISRLAAREIEEDDGTMSGRTLIWYSCIRQCTKTLRRFILGISPLSREKICNIYDGRHDIAVYHAHNIYLELLRKHGLLGFITWMALVISWCVSGIKTLFSEKTSVPMKYLCIGAAAILLMGMAEPVPFSTSLWCYTGIPFFMICGYCTRIWRKDLG